MSQIGQRRRKLERLRDRMGSLRKSLLEMSKGMMDNLDAPSLSMLEQADTGLLYALQCIAAVILYISSVITMEDMAGDEWIEEVVSYLNDCGLL